MKRKVIVLSIPIVLLIILFGVYLTYGATLIDPSNEKSLVSYLTIDKDSPSPTLGRIEYYDDICVVVYEDYSFGDQSFASKQFIKSKWYKNKYICKASSKASYPAAAESVHMYATGGYDLENEDGTIRLIYYISAKPCGKSFEYNVINKMYGNEKEKILSGKISGDEEYYLEMVYFDVAKENLQEFAMNLELDYKEISNEKL